MTAGLPGASPQTESMVGEERQDEPLPPVTAAERPASPLAALFAAVQFLLITPAFIQRTFTDREMGASVGFYPLVGLLLGAILAGMDALLALILPLPVRTVLVIAAWVS